jgi:hypothetical protein
MEKMFAPSSPSVFPKLPPFSLSPTPNLNHMGDKPLQGSTYIPRPTAPPPSNPQTLRHPVLRLHTSNLTSPRLITPPKNDIPHPNASRIRSLPFPHSACQIHSLTTPRHPSRIPCRPP